MTSVGNIPMDGELQPEDLETFRQASKQDQLMAIALLHRDRENLNFMIQRQPSTAVIYTLLFAYIAILISIISPVILLDSDGTPPPARTFIMFAIVVIAALIIWHWYLRSTQRASAQLQKVFERVSMRLVAYEHVLEKQRENNSNTHQCLLRRCQAGFRSLIRGIH